VLENIGNEPAVNVSTKLGPKILGPDGKTEINTLNVFRSVAFFAPAKRFRIFLGYSTAYFAADQPTTFTAVITYSDQSGNHYSESITHNLDIYQDMPHGVEGD
jgi:hypothetical protein